MGGREGVGGGESVGGLCGGSGWGLRRSRGPQLSVQEKREKHKTVKRRSISVLCPELTEALTSLVTQRLIYSYLVSFPDHWSQQSVVWEWDNPHVEVSHTARNPGSMGGKVYGEDYLTCSSFRSTSCRTLALCVNDLRRSESTLNNVHRGMMYAGMQDMIGTSLSGCVHYNHYLIWAVCP